MCKGNSSSLALDAYMWKSFLIFKENLEMWKSFQFKMYESPQFKNVDLKC